MITVFSEEHRKRNAETELYGGRLVTPHECPERAQIVLERVMEERRTAELLSDFDDYEIFDADNEQTDKAARKKRKPR